MGEEGGAEAVVDIDDGDAGGAGGEHGVEGCLAMAGGAVAGGGGDGDEGVGEEAAEDAGECSFHACNGDDGGGVAQGAEVGEEAMNAGDTYVGDLHELMSEKLQGEGGFVGDGEVGGAGGDNGDVVTGGVVVGGGESEAEAAGGGAVGGEGSVPAVAGEDFAGFFVADAGGEGFAVGGEDAGEVVGDLLGGFVLSEDDFGGALAELAMEVEGGVAQLLEGELSQFVDRGFGVDGASSDLFE